MTGFGQSQTLRVTAMSRVEQVAPRERTVDDLVDLLLEVVAGAERAARAAR